MEVYSGRCNRKVESFSGDVEKKKVSWKSFSGDVTERKKREEEKKKLVEEWKNTV